MVLWVLSSILCFEGDRSLLSEKIFVDCVPMRRVHVLSIFVCWWGLLMTARVV